MDPREILKRLHDGEADPTFSHDEEEVVVLRPVLDEDDVEDDDDDIEELDDFKKIIEGGKVIKKTAQQMREKAKKGKPAKWTMAQYRAALKNIKKAGRRAHTSVAKLRRKKSMAKRERMGLNESVADLLDINDLNLALQELLYDHFAENYDLNDEQVSSLTEIIVAGVEVSHDGDGLLLEYPRLSLVDDNIEADESRTVATRFDLEEGVTTLDALAYILDGYDLADRMV